MTFRAVRETYDRVMMQAAATTAAITATGREFLKSNPTADQLDTCIAAIDQGIADLVANPLHSFLGGGLAVKELQALRDDYAKQREGGH